MANILLYGDIQSYSAQDVITRMNAVPANEALILNVNSNGGEVRYGWGIINALQSREGSVKLINDGAAYSMAAMAFCYVPKENASAIDTSEFLFHRAGYAQWYEESDYFTDEDKESLQRMNDSLRKALEARIDVPAFEAGEGITFEQLFSMDQRPSVTITAKKAKKYGLIGEIITITPKKKAEIEAKMQEITAHYSGHKVAAKSDENNKTKTMNIETLKSEHPSVYAQIFNLGKTQGSLEMKQIAEAWAFFADVDSKAVMAGIKTGAAMTQLEIIEMTQKQFTKPALEAIKTDSKGDVTPAATGEAKTKEQEEKEAFAARVRKNSTFLSAK